jgi:soluble epoxide hydrolase / lipid-phosphate phosphatase
MESTITSRGHTYSYYRYVSTTGKPTILFLHGFPSTHRDWISQIDHFKAEGYGIVAPDLLGYGKTSAPEDVKEYKIQGITQDVINVLDACKVERAISVAHDWYASLVPLMCIVEHYLL